ncbi:MAG: DUF1015 domain-containing protein [Acidobacteria bacterium]|nr:DUF1015 domain-containing protein [Acidobacteriota bacterium]
MASIFPFAALRPVPQAAAAVAAVPYDVVSTQEARALAQGNPLSFLHVSRAEIDLPAATDPHADEVYERAAENFGDLRSRAPLVEEDSPTFYVYRLQMGSHAQTGIAACFSIDEYDNDLIKKHEKTRPDKEDDRTRHMLAIGAQTGPVFLTYVASSEIDALVARTSSQDRLFDFAAPDGVRHEIWTVPSGDHDALVAAFAAVPHLYIADGHHRAASAGRTRRALAGRGSGEHDRMLAVAFPNDQMQILPYHRIVKDLNGRTAAQFLDAVRQRVPITESPAATPTHKGEVAMYLDGAWHGLELGSVAPKHAGGGTLDVSILQDALLEPVLGITDVRTDKRIDFVGGIRGTAALQHLVDSGHAAVAFSLYPVTVSDLMEISDAGGIMPPKSTWFEPKLRDGLLSHLI